MKMKTWSWKLSILTCLVILMALSQWFGRSQTDRVKEIANTAANMTNMAVKAVAISESLDTDWTVGYKKGFTDGREVGMTLTYCFMATRPNFTNYLDFEAQALQWSSNAVEMYKKAHATK